MDRRWVSVLLRALCVALGSIVPIMPAFSDDRASQAGIKSELVGATSGDAVELLYFPPPLIVEPLVPPVRPEDELERDPGGVLVLPNVRANPSPGSCFRNGGGNICAQNETTIAVNPTDNDNWVAGANDYSGSNILADRAQSSCGFYFSKDAAQTWQGGLLPIQPGFTGGGDPSVAFGGNGNVYYACMNFELIPSDETWSTGASAMFVFKSTDGGENFTGPTEVVSSATMTGFHDKEFITVGSLTDKVYMSWVLGDDIRFAGSDDEAATFDAPAPTDNVLVNDPENDSNKGPVIATVEIPNPEGPGSEEVYVAWFSDLNGDTPARILFDKSTNGGASFGTDIVVENDVNPFPKRQFHTVFGDEDRTSLLGEFGDPVSNPSNAFRVNSFPSMAACKNGASPYFGQVYIVFADNRFGDGDIFFKKSEDRGDHWPGTLTRRVNDDPSRNGKDQFFPSISVDENCKINVSFYDRRDDENNQKFHLYFSHSTDGGATFSPNARVTTAPSTNVQFEGFFVGDYLQNASTVATSSEFHHQVDRAAALWMDTRDGGQDVYAASILQTQGGTWINVDVDLVADRDATDLEFVFPALTGEFGSFYHGPANPFQDHLVIVDEDPEETVLTFFNPEPGPLAPGDTAHVGFMVETLPEVVNSFWTGSGNIGSIPMATVDFTYDPVARAASASICNDREDGRTIGVSGPQYAILATPIELEDLNATQLPAALAARNSSLAVLPAPPGPLAPGSCASLPIPDSVRQFEAILLTVTLTFTDRGSGGGRLVLFAQKIAKDAREVRGRPDTLYRYAAKLICGTQPSTKDLRLARGHYATAINILNPDPRPARIEKTLSLAIPPGWQKPGEVRTIGRETLPSARALAVDCDDVRRRVFKGKLPASFIDGFVTIVSDRSLDVTGVYTTATLNAEGTAEDHSSIHLESVTERVVRVRQGPRRADLVVDREPSVDAICDSARCRVSVRFTVRNIGDGAAGAFNVALVRRGTNVILGNVPVPKGLEPAQALTETSTVELPVPKNPAERRICIRADAPLNQVAEDDETNNERCFAF